MAFKIWKKKVQEKIGRSGKTAKTVLRTVFSESPSSYAATDF